MKLNIATKFTLSRIVFALLIIIILLFPFDSVGIDIPKYFYKNIIIDLKFIIAGILFILASITDFIDGNLARKKDEVTDFGKFADAIADKVLVNSILITLAGLGYISIVIPVIITARDTIVDSIRMMAANKGKVQAAKFWGKLKTASLMIGITLTLFYNLPFEMYGLSVSDALLFFGTFLSLVSMIEYYNLNKKEIFS